MLNYQNVIKTQIPIFGFRLFWWGTIAIAFTYFNISQSIVQGKLSLPPVYDDVSYLLQGAIWVNAFREGGLGELMAAPIANSPVMVFIAFLGFMLFGFYTWAPYAINSLVIFGLLIGLDLLSSKLPQYQRRILPLITLTYPIVANLVMEFRPDAICAITMAFYISACLRTNWRSSSWQKQVGLSSLLAFALLCKPSIFPITLFVAITALFSSILAHLSWKNLRGIQLRLLIEKLAKPIAISIGISLLLVSPYYLLGGLKQTLDYIQVVVFGTNRDMWTPSFPLSYSLVYYLTGRGGWMMGSWFWLNIALLNITLAAVLYQRQLDLSKRAIAATVILVTAYITVTIPSTKSPFLGLIVTAIILIFSYLTMAYWLELLNSVLKKSVSTTLSQFLSLTIIVSLIFFQWKSFPFVGGGISLLSRTETAQYYKSLDNIVIVFEKLNPTLSKSNRKSIFLPASTSFINTTNLNLNFQFNHIQVFKATGLDLNRENVDDFQIYEKKSRSADYVILARSPSVGYPSLKNKKGNDQFGEQLYGFLETSSQFERLDRQDSPIIKGEILIYHNKRPSE